MPYGSKVPFHKVLLFSGGVALAGSSLCWSGCKPQRLGQHSPLDGLRAGFATPPAEARPGVYWYFMDGNLSRQGMTKDLESMKRAGIGRVLFLEVNVGVPRGKVDFFSPEWQELFRHAVREAERLGITITLGVGPGWTGSGGPWVSGAQSMQHLVASTTEVDGVHKGPIVLLVPPPKKPYFGSAFTPEGEQRWRTFYADVAVLAYPSPAQKAQLADSDDKALYYRAPYSSVPGVVEHYPPMEAAAVRAAAIIAQQDIVDLTDKLLPDGTLQWAPPPGKWTIMRFGVRNNGAATRPAPLPGVGFEADKFDTTALNAHLNVFTSKLLPAVGEQKRQRAGGLTTLHMDSWEMGAQNWTPHFRAEFRRRRGYDPLPFYPVYTGRIVQSPEVSERFLWDLRQTAQELVLEFHAGHLKTYGRRHGLSLSIEPYDMNPTSDLELGAVADIPMGEFWSKGYGYNSAFSCLEAASIGHVNGRPIVAAEAFTAQNNEGWKQHPASVKEQGDWAFSMGINQFYYHTFQHQPLDDRLRPGMTMGPYGVHWDRNQTWWPMAGAYHEYISRCQYLLRQGTSVADVLYLAPEAAPNVFRAPESALTGPVQLPDHKGYAFDACAPSQLLQATVVNQKIVFPRGATYELLVLPAWKTMTPTLLAKVAQLVASGATVVGSPPQKSPSLTGFPQVDVAVQTTARQVWGDLQPPAQQTAHRYGQGQVVWGGEIDFPNKKALYPAYDLTAGLLAGRGVAEDFAAPGPVRFIHRTGPGWDIYFVANKTGEVLTTPCTFRTSRGAPELWDPLTGQTRRLPEAVVRGGQTTVPLRFEGYQSFFVVFANGAAAPAGGSKNFPESTVLATLTKPWDVRFDPTWGGPAKTTFPTLTDWKDNPRDSIRYYSGTATYRQRFDRPAGGQHKQLFLDLGTVRNLARVRLNGHDLGVVWTAPWRVNITREAKAKGNELVIEVVNLWPNRLIGDEQLPDDGIQKGAWPAWLEHGTPRPSRRYTFTTFKHYSKDAPLLSSGLLGPVTIQAQ